MLITNKDDNDPSLEVLLQGSWAKTKSIDLLVGYFFYSGFYALCEGLENIKMRVLVGLEAQRDVANLIRVINNIDASEESRDSIRESYYSNFKEIFNKTDFFDSKKSVEAFKLFCSKIKDGSLEIRKTEKPNHAKMYLVGYDANNSDSGAKPGMLVVGSSNLSIEGLKKRFEINYVSFEKAVYEKGKKIFNGLWENSIILAEKDNWEKYKSKVINGIWFNKSFSPYEIYLKVLDEYFSVNVARRIKSPHEYCKKYSNLKYQTDAIKMALDIISKHNGVIIADVVGLGKSIIGSTVAANLSLDTIIIAPPHLKDQWEDYSSEFLINAKVFSSGKIEDALSYYDKHSDNGEKFLIIIDEAHRYRSQNTINYKNLHTLCAGNKVMLLTATPFNNAPQDIYSIIKLFQIPNKPTLKTVNNFNHEFWRLSREYQRLAQDKNLPEKTLRKRLDNISERIRGLIGPVVVRRSRLDLEKISDYKNDLEKQKISFPEVNDPVALEYPLGRIQKKYAETLEKLSPGSGDGAKQRYKAARYQAASYIRNDKEEAFKDFCDKSQMEYNMIQGRQVSLSDFIRRLLVRRFESSLYAFYKSLSNLISSSEEILDWVEKRKAVPIAKKGILPDPENLMIYNQDEVSKEINEKLDKPKEEDFFEIPMEFINQNFLPDMEYDLKLLKEIKDAWFEGKEQKSTIEKMDPKINQFATIIKHQIEKEPERKLVVFSEFSDTASYVFQVLKKRGLRVLFYSGLKATKKNKKTVLANFDASLPPNEQRNDYDILVATDAISEGYSLHRAGAIYNYDIPYNPTRVIQRVGRINRINKKVFSELYIYNYFPSFEGENTTRTKAISTLKMNMIQSVMGGDTRILSPDESLNSFFSERYKKEKELADTKESWETRHRQAWNESRQNKQLMAQISSMPYRTKIARSDKSEGIIIFGKKGNDYIFKFRDEDNNIQTLYPETALDLFCAGKEEKSEQISPDFYDKYQELKDKLFREDYSEENSQTVRNAFEKIDSFLKEGKTKNKDYFKDLEKVIRLDALSTCELKKITRLRPSEMDALPRIITQKFLNRVLKQADEGKNRTETVILAEEFKGEQE